MPAAATLVDLQNRQRVGPAVAAMIESAHDVRASVSTIVSTVVEMLPPTAERSGLSAHALLLHALGVASLSFAERLEASSQLEDAAAWREIVRVLDDARAEISLRALAGLAGDGSAYPHPEPRP